VPVLMSSAATPVKNIPGIAKAIPGSDENHSSSRRNHCSPSARNPVRLHPGIVFAITPESLFALPRNPQLPAKFHFKEARTVYARQNQATTDFLRKAESLGILRHENRFYIKTEATELADFSSKSNDDIAA
jgi:hypothetical protein